MNELVALYNDKGEFIWTEQRDRAAILLALGHNKAYVAKQVGISDRTVFNWLKEPQFEKEVDDLSLIMGSASKAYRARFINQAILQFKDKEGKLDLEGTTLLDWLKEARMNAEGVKLGIVSELASIVEEKPSMDRSRQDRSISLLEVETEEAE
jgi:hypothetical protein